MLLLWLMNDMALGGWVADEGGARHARPGQVAFRRLCTRLVQNLVDR